MVIVNLTVWESIEALKAFAYRGTHRDFFRRRDEWFVEGASRTALWWIPAGTIPTTEDATRRLAFIDAFGRSPYAFEMGRTEPPLVIHRVPLPDGAMVVAELDDEIVGGAAYRRTADTSAVVDRIYVGTQARGMRIGAALVAELEATARLDGMDHLALETRNAALAEMYAKFGFRRQTDTELTKALTKTPSAEPARLA
jgi:GNAT superfamily N-acetyltransferase